MSYDHNDTIKQTTAPYRRENFSHDNGYTLQRKSITIRHKYGSYADLIIFVYILFLSTTYAE